MTAVGIVLLAAGIHGITAPSELMRITGYSDSFICGIIFNLQNCKVWLNRHYDSSSWLTAEGDIKDREFWDHISAACGELWFPGADTELAVNVCRIYWADKERKSRRDCFDQLDESAAQGMDNQHLDTLTQFGFANRKCAQQSENVAEFVPTRHELIQLTRYWMIERIAHEFDGWLDETVTKGDWHWTLYINDRLRPLTDTLNSDELQNVQQASEACFRRLRNLSDYDWTAFSTGTLEDLRNRRRGTFDPLPDPSVVDPSAE